MTPGGNDRWGGGSKWIRKAKRWRIYDRDVWRCVWCLAPVYAPVHGVKFSRAVARTGALAESDLVLATLDHVIPRLGRSPKVVSNEAENLLTTCWECNSARGHASAVAFAFASVQDDPEAAGRILDRVIDAITTPLCEAIPLAPSVAPCQSMTRTRNTESLGGLIHGTKHARG